MPKRRLSYKQFDRNTKTQAHGQLDTRWNAWNYNNTHRHRCRPRVSHLNTSACSILCHSFHVLCQQMSIQLKMQRTNGQTDRQADGWRDRRLAYVTSTWYRTRCGQKWKLEECIKKVSLLDTVILTLTYDIEKLIRSGHCHYQCFKFEKN